jgi:hypothetical protein
MKPGKSPEVVVAEVLSAFGVRHDPDRRVRRLVTDELEKQERREKEKNGPPASSS